MFLLAALLYLFSSDLQAREYLIGVKGECPYFCQKDSKGYVHEILEKFFKSRNDNVKVKYIPYARLKTALRKGEVDFIFLDRSSTSFDYDLKIIGPSLGVKLIGVLSKSSIDSSFVSPNDLNKYDSLISVDSIQMMKNTIFINKIKVSKKNKISGYKIYPRFIKMLQMNRADIAIGDYTIFRYLLKNDNHNLKVTPTSFGGFQALSLVSKNDFYKFDEINDSFNKYIESIREKGSLDKKLERYNISDWKSVIP